MTTENGLAPRPSVTSLDFTDEQRQMIRDTYANGANDKEFSVLIEIAKKRRLDPMLRQIHFVQRWNTELKRVVWAPQVSIDGLRAIAQRTGLYDGQDEPIFEERDGSLYLCKVAVYRKDWLRPAVGIAYWSEYVQTTKDGSVTRMWRQMPHVMLSKVAESIALRKAFPEDLSGLFTAEEMMQAENGNEPERRSSPRQPKIVDEPQIAEPQQPAQLPAPATTKTAPVHPANDAPAAPAVDEEALRKTFEALRRSLEETKSKPVDECLRAIVSVWRGMGATVKNLPEDARKGLWTVARECVGSKWGTSPDLADAWLRAALKTPPSEPTPLPIRTSKKETLPTPEAVELHFRGLKSRKHLEAAARAHGSHPWARPELIKHGVAILETDASDVAQTIDAWALKGREESEVA